MEMLKKRNPNPPSRAEQNSRNHYAWHQLKTHWDQVNSELHDLSGEVRTLRALIEGLVRILVDSPKHDDLHKLQKQIDQLKEKPE
ncbi:hypothetical protein [Candidatus Poriferisocius sp.]|uniref:hypothetical protein n=1 Tax=Candidatus Poriferisocius sp. TaxID=3101276 RepID=UPI003B014909